MSFLNVFLLGGALAFLAPLLIHLLNRSRFQTLDWGAMHLLDAAMKQNSRRIRWESWLLLLLRCLIPILFALCLARPVVTAFRVPGATDSAAIAILIDDSSSMQRQIGTAVTSGNQLSNTQSAFEGMQSEFQNIVDSNSQVEWSALAVGAGASDLLDGTTRDAGQVSRVLESVRAGADSVDPVAAIEAGLQKLDVMTGSNLNLILSTDFQRSEWGGISSEQFNRLRRQLRDREVPVQLYLMSPPAETEASINRNLSVQLRVLEDVVLIDDPMRIEATVRNDSKVSQQECRVVFRVDGRDLASRELTVPPNAEQVAVFACSFIKTGLHQISVEVDDSGSVHGDDVACAVIEARDSYRVLLVNEGGSAAVPSDSGYLKLALSPFEEPSKANLFEVETTPPRSLGKLGLDRFDVVLLVGLPGLSQIATTSLAEFVRRGGGLVVFPGTSHSNWYAENSEVGVGLLPAMFEDIIEVPEAEARRIAQARIEDPVLEVFNSQEAGNLRAIKFRQWAQLDWPGRDKSEPKVSDQAGPVNRQSDDAAVNVLLRLESQDPLLVAKSFGRGTVVQAAFSGSEAWSNLSSQPVFVPLVQRVVHKALDERVGALNLPCGKEQLFELKAEGSSEVVGDSSDGTQVEFYDALAVSLPNAAGVRAGSLVGYAKPETVDGEIGFRFNETRFPGFFAADVAKAGSRSGRELQPFSFATQLSLAESRLEVLSEEERVAIAEQLGATLIASATDLAKEMQLKRDGKELWRWFLVGVLSLLFVELLLMARIAGRAS